MTIRPPGRPSASHEQRRGDLDTFAALLGFGLPVAPPRGVIPDVALAHIADGRLFVGEAKHTESATDRSSAARLLVYLDWLRRLSAPPPSFVGLACPPRHADAWAELVSALAADVGLVAAPPWVRSLSPLTDVAVLAVRRTSVLRM